VVLLAWHDISDNKLSNKSTITTIRRINASYENSLPINLNAKNQYGAVQENGTNRIQVSVPC